MVKKKKRVIEVIGEILDEQRASGQIARRRRAQDQWARRNPRAMAAFAAERRRTLPPDHPYA